MNVLDIIQIAAIAPIFFGTVIPLFRVALWAFTAITKNRNPMEEFAHWRIWLGWTVYLTLAVWSFGAGIVVTVMYCLWLKG